MIHDHASLAAARAYGLDPADRVQRFTPLVRRLAWHFAASVEEFMEPEDLIQVGMIALVECASRHDRPGEDGFAAYAKLRVRGAMVDAIRASRPGSRRNRALTRRVDEARRALEQEIGSSPSREQILERSGLSEDEMAALEKSPEMRFEPIEDNIEAESAGFVDEEPDALAQIIAEEDRETLTHAIAALPERLQMVIQLYFVEELNLAEIGAVLDVSVPRVHQLKASALKQLRSMLEN